MTIHTINSFMVDGRLDIEEPEQIINIAKRDGIVDANEKRVLAEIIARLTPEELTGEMQRHIEEVRKEYNF